MEHSNSYWPVCREILFILRIIASIFKQNLRAVAHALCHRPLTAGGGVNPRPMVDREQRSIFFLKLFMFSPVIILLVRLTCLVIIIESNARSHQMKLLKGQSITLTFV
jgi:hypothetical protein